MKSWKLPESVLSYFESEVFEIANDPEAFGLDEEETEQYVTLMKYVDLDAGVFYAPSPKDARVVWSALGDLTNHVDALSLELADPELRREYKKLVGPIGTLSSRVSKLPGAWSLAPNRSSDARRRGGVQAGEKKSERKDALLFDVEGVDPTLVPLARKWDHKIPVKPKGMSRLEYFLQMVDDDPDAAVQLSEKEAAAYVKGLAKEQHTYHKPGVYQPGEYENDPYEFVDDFFEGEEPTEEEIETFVQYLEDVLTSREIKMLRRIISKEGLSNREMQCFYRKASGKLQRNGSIWI